MRQALGRGLGALIPSGDGATPGSVAARKIPITAIRPNHLQPRKTFDPQKLSELAESIKEHGLAQPILVSYDAATNSYELIAGERRLRACQLAGLAEVAAVVRNPGTDRERLAVALIENLQREDLNPVDEALGFLRLIKEFAITQAQLSQVVGKSKSAISNTLRLLDLPEDVQKALQSGQLTEGHARALLALNEPLERHKLFRMILEQGLSVRDVESYCQRVTVGQPEKPRRAPRQSKNGNKSADEKALEEALQQVLGTRVEIRTRDGGGKGTIRIHFYALSDFERIVEFIKR